jgi:hypothetical protein
MRSIIKTILTEQSKDIVIKNMYQNLLDKTLSKMREKYKEQEISSANWYLTIFAKVDKIIVVGTPKLLDNRMVVPIEIKWDRGDIEEYWLNTVTQFLTRELEPYGNPYFKII